MSYGVGSQSYVSCQNGMCPWKRARANFEIETPPAKIKKIKMQNVNSPDLLSSNPVKGY